MKTKTSLIARLTTALLFGTAWSVAAIDSTPCQRWDVSGQWELRMTNGLIVPVNLQQGKWQQQSANLTGTSEGHVISGNITGNSFTMAISVDAPQDRRYKGTIDSSGKIEGTVAKTVSGLPWVSSRKMKCADGNAPISKQKTGEASTNPSGEADESASTDTEHQHKTQKKKKKNKKNHHHDDDEKQGND